MTTIRYLSRDSDGLLHRPTNGRGKSMRSIASLVLVVASCVVPRLALAQLPNLVEVGGQFVPPAELESRSPAKAAIASYYANLNVPLPLTRNTLFIPGLSYHLDSLAYSDTPPNFTELRAFHSLEAPLILVQLFPHDWALSLRLAPAIAGDFHGVDTSLFHLGALALGTHSFSPRFSLGGGAIVTYAFGTVLPLPAVSVEWKPFDGAQVLGFLPALLSAKYTFGGCVELGVRADIGGNSYSIRDSRVTDMWPCVSGVADDPETSADETVANPSECIDHVAYSVVVVGAQVGVRLFESVWWTAFTGASVFRRLDQQNGRDENVTGGKLTIPNTLVVRSGLAWRVPTESAEAKKSKPAP